MNVNSIIVNNDWFLIIFISALIQLLVKLYKLNPASMVPVSLKITNPVKNAHIGSIIQTQYFGKNPVFSSNLDMHRVSLMNRIENI